MKEKQERQARREAIKQQAEKDSKPTKEAKSGERHKPAEKTKAASGEGKSEHNARGKKEDRRDRDEDTQGRNAKGKGGKGVATATMRAMAMKNAYAAAKKAKNSNLSQTNTPSKRRPNLSYTKFWYLKPLPLPIWHTKWPLKASKWLKP